MKKDTKTYLILVVIILLIITGIYYFKNLKNQTPEEQTIVCIAEKTILYSQTNCAHCIQQKEIIGGYIGLFNVVECDKEPAKCLDIKGTPTWEINGKFYEGVKSIKELAEFADCECKANINVIKNDSVSCTLENTDQSCTTEVENICTK